MNDYLRAIGTLMGSCDKAIVQKILRMELH